MIIEYTLTCERTGYEVVCCGEFRDSLHWKWFCETEALRGWKVSNKQVISPNKDSARHC